MADFDWAEATDIIPSMAGLVPEPGERSIRLQCLPLASLVLAMGNPTVHYFSLDIEGAELQVVHNALLGAQRVVISVCTFLLHGF